MNFIVSWSGGKDSTFMLLDLVRSGVHIDEVVCCDTTIEFEGMYIHQKKVVDLIHSYRPELKFTFLKPDNDFEFYMFDYVKQRGSRAGQCGLGWANPNYIWCRKYLKLDIITKYLRSKYGSDYRVAIGIAFDEYDRYDFSDETKVYPLIEKKITELMCLHGCWDAGIDFEGLYDHFFRVSCWCCPLQSIKDLYILYSFYPHLWCKLREYDDLQNNRFRKDYTLQELEDTFSRLTKVSEPNDDIKVYPVIKVSDPEVI